MELNFSNFGTAIASKEQGQSILDQIKTLLSSNQSIILNMSGVDIMTTFCAKQIFGSLYLELGPDNFFSRVQFRNASEDMKIIISQSIQNAVETDRD